MPKRRKRIRKRRVTKKEEPKERRAGR